MTTATKDWAREYLAAWDTFNVDNVLAWMTDDIDYVDTTLKHGAVGKEKMAKFIQASFTNVPDCKMEYVRGSSDGDTFWFEWIMHPMGVPGISAGRLRDGKICFVRDYWNGALYKVPNT